MKKRIIITALVNAGGTALYVFAIASLLFYAPTVFGLKDQPDTVLAPVIMLMLLVISAAVTGFGVFGRPLMWYLDGKKADALQLLGLTLVFLVITAGAFMVALLS